MVSHQRHRVIRNLIQLYLRSLEVSQHCKCNFPRSRCSIASNRNSAFKLYKWLLWNWCPSPPNKNQDIFVDYSLYYSVSEEVPIQNLRWNESFDFLSFDLNVDFNERTSRHKIVPSENADDACGSFELLIYVGKKSYGQVSLFLELKACTADPPWVCVRRLKVVPPLMSHEHAKSQLIAALATIRFGFKRPICMRNNKFFTRSRFWLCWQALMIEPKITMSASKESSACKGQLLWFQR